MLKFSKAFVYDTDASTYIEAVEAADGQPLETKVRLAINNFVIGCKNDGIWNAIKASCILAGARTLAGALVPLKGTAPTNFNFVSGDYNRKTGLVGDGSTKYLNSNRANNADPQNSKHLSVYVSSGSSGVGQTYIGADGGLIGASAINRSGVVRLHAATSASVGAPGIASGLYAIGRATSASFNSRYNQAILAHLIASEPPSSSTLFVLAQNSVGSAISHSTDRLAFYSIGESLDLALLDARVTTLVTDIKIALDGVTDPDARRYIEAVEAADGQLLESGVAQAIETFIKGCKADNTWNSIQSCCILAGARTLSGALVPLKGTAPTNFNFVSGDYNRKTGLVGNGSTKYLNSNRADNADPQNSQHVSVYATTNSSSGSFIGVRPVIATALNSTSVGPAAAVNTPFRSRISIFDAAAQGTRSAASVTGFIGLSRPASASFISRVSGSNETITSTSATPSSLNQFVFCRNSEGTADTFTASRLAFYSIGESLDLALLDARVTTLINSIASAIDGVTDADARAYINAVENADGQALEVGVAQAYQAFITGCKSDGIWNAIKASCILAGARTLSGALVPLKGTAPTNFNFVSGDYNRKTGLVGDGSTKYLNSNRANNADPQDSKHLSVYVSSGSSGTGQSYIGASGGLVGASALNRSGVNRLHSATTATITSPGIAVGLYGIRRNNSAAFDSRYNQSNQSHSVASEPPSSLNLSVFAQEASPGAVTLYTVDRLAFYSIGESLDLALLDARVTTLVNTLNSVIP